MIHREPAPGRRHFLGLAATLTVLTIYGSIIPLWLRPIPLGEAVARFRTMQAVDPTLLYGRGDWMVNMVQYAAMTFCWAGALGVDRRSLPARLAVLALVPLGIAFATALEFVQLYFPPRTVSRNDLVVEWLGVIAGVAGWLLAGPRLTASIRRLWGRRGLKGLTTQALPAYLLILVVVHAMPFDLVIGRDELARKYAEGRIRLVPFADLVVGGLRALPGLASTLIAFVPLGLLLEPTLRRNGRDGSNRALAIGFGIASALEGLQLLIFTRIFDATDIVVGSLGVWIGVWTAVACREVAGPSWAGLGALGARWVGRLARRRAVLVMLAVLAWAATLALASWWPLHFTTSATAFHGVDPDLTDENTSIVGLRRFTWAPFADYYWRSRYNALDQFVQRSLSFAPLGVLMALGFGRRERIGAALTVLSALAFGTLLEFGQYFLPNRHPSTTDVLIETMGAWLAFALTHRLVHAVEPEAESLGHARYSVVHTEPRPSPPPLRAHRPDRRSAWWGERGLAWLDSRSERVRLAIVCASAIVLTLVLVKLALHLGLI